MYAKRFKHGFFYHLGAVDMARRTLTKHYKISADRRETKLGIECCNAESGCRGNAQPDCRMTKRVFRQITVNILNLLQDGYKRADGVFIFVYDRLNET